ncbi:hypothetical protein BpHYR1_040630 [Brachionus plicatilis]|uniref:Uncharacterized protein n=1 Tax=Brachionus plicatilis TaxID=10195 RepID=A0A3M7RYR6_BRAPC|nr:hypothetical protein BpHYR1_040630 [Brachionus plicatilis]
MIVLILKFDLQLQFAEKLANIEANKKEDKLRAHKTKIKTKSLKKKVSKSLKLGLVEFYQNIRN